LSNAGNTSHQEALEFSSEEYEKFRIIQDDSFLSDFDEEIQRLKK
jgi:hypothetical protein